MFSLTSNIFDLKSRCYKTEDRVASPSSSELVLFVCLIGFNLASIFFSETAFSSLLGFGKHVTCYHRIDATSAHDEVVQCFVDQSKFY